MKTISFTLDEAGLDKAIKELRAYKQDLERKCNVLKDRVAEYLKQQAQAGFDAAIVDDLTPASGGPISASVSVEVQPGDDVTLVIANGEDAVWVEFGAGVFHNGPAGTSPNPYGAGLGYTIGSMGPNGKRNIWAYRGSDGELVFTHGTPAAMPLAKAVMSLDKDLEGIVREVFTS